MKRVGFIINSRVPAVRSLLRGMRPHHLVTGWDDAGSPMSFMRFRWIAGEVNRAGALRYELYKPWQNYDAVVFLKSMGPECEALMARLQAGGTKAVFEANVDYYSSAPSVQLPGELVPTPGQRTTAIAMTSGANAVIASSRRLGEICSAHASQVHIVSDNVPPAFVPEGNPPDCFRGGKLHLWWSGMAAKLYDFLLIADALRAHAGSLHLHFVTREVEEAMSRWPSEQAGNFRSLLAAVPHSFHVFQDIPELMKRYHENGGVIISPRYLDSPYNNSHTEWKLTLGLACGLPGIGSAQPSYVEAADVAGEALTICRDAREWSEEFDRILRDAGRFFRAGLAARAPILARYGTPAVAASHAAVLSNLLR